MIASGATAARARAQRPPGSDALLIALLLLLLVALGQAQ